MDRECRLESWGDFSCRCWRCRNPSDLLAPIVRPRASQRPETPTPKKVSTT